MRIIRQSLEEQTKSEASERTPVPAHINAFVVMSDHCNFQMLSFGKLDLQIGEEVHLKKKK